MWLWPGDILPDRQMCQGNIPSMMPAGNIFVVNRDYVIKVANTKSSVLSPQAKYPYGTVDLGP